MAAMESLLTGRVEAAGRLVCLADRFVRLRDDGPEVA
jgi:hypothetical protein